MRRSAVAVLLAALALAAPGCSSVPTSGKATVVADAPTAPAPDAGAQGEIRAAGPKRDAASNPVELVTGFLNAEQDTSKDGTIRALDYLTVPTVWDPTGETLVYTTKEVELGDSVDPAAIDVRVTYSTLARIVTDASGAGDYRPDLGTDVQTFQVKKVDGAYRIAGIPRGRRVNDNNLDQVFRRVVPYFCANRDCDTFVPEPIFVLKETSPPVAAVISRLLVGPTTVLKDFQPYSLFPRGTVLLTAPQPEDNVVEVTFSRELADGAPADRPKIVAQIVWTLTALDSRIAAVSIKVADGPFEFKNGMPADVQGQAQWPAYDPDALYAARASYFNLGGALGSYRPSSAVQAGRALGSTGGPAVDVEDKTVAISAQAKRFRFELRVGPVETGPLVTVIKSEHMTKPSWGVRGDGVWVVTQEGNGAPKVYSVPGNPKPERTVRAPELTSRVYAFEAAPDGLRVAAIVERDGRRSLEIGYFDRSSLLGGARRVGGFRPIVTGASVTPLSVAWVDSGKLAFIGQHGEEDPEVFTVLVDGTDLRSLNGSQALLRRNRPAPAPQPQLVPIAMVHDSEDTRRGDRSSPDALMVIIDGNATYARDGIDWTRLPYFQSSRKPVSSTFR